MNYKEIRGAWVETFKKEEKSTICGR